MLVNLPVDAAGLSEPVLKGLGRYL
jgi:hypothetical protein